MKKIFTTLSFLGLLLTCDLNGQTLNSMSSGEQPVKSSDTKTKYIKNQDYLSKSALKDFKAYYGDSLLGFDEEAAKISIINRGFYGSEFHYVMNYTKRDFIEKKYKIGQYAPRPADVATIGNGKPLGNSSNINVAPCVNEDFEATPLGQYTSSTAVTGWTIQSGQNNGNNGACNTNTSYVWNQPISEFWIVQTPILGHPYIGTIPNSPLGGTRVAKLQNTVMGSLMTRISTTFPVTSANALFQFAYCGSWDGSGHGCCDQPFFTINMYDCNGAPLGCSSMSLTAAGPSCPSGVTGYSVVGNNISYTPTWVNKFIDLTPYIGTCVTLQVVNGDCSGGAHHGELYFDARCGGQLVSPGLPGTGGTISGPVSFCAGSNIAQIAAPLGYATYSWIAPPGSPIISPSNATLSTLSIPNPIPGAIYTVNLNTPSGCSFIATNTIITSTVSIIGLGSGTTCAGGASGTATVQGHGSGSGYNYLWTNTANNATVGTSASISGLAPGIYSIQITGAGSSGCGVAGATVQVTTGPPGIIELLKPYCGNEAYLGTTGGSNYQWYNGLSAISASLGGAAANYTVVNPVNQSIYWLSYLSQFGCQDSVKFTLVASQPGSMGVQNISWVCLGGTNGTALVNMIPAPGAPPGANSFSVYNTSTATPVYNASVYPTPSNTFALTGLAAGTYSVKAFDGSCKYGALFSVLAYTYNYNVSPNSPTLCPGNTIAANITFTSPPSPTQYSYSWTPNIFLAGNANTYSQTLITPTIPAGTQSTIIYTVIVTPSIVNCPTTKTIAITAIHPPTPTITAIPNLCNNSSPYTIITNPSGGTFFTGITGTNNPIGQSSGIINPALANIGSNNSFTYAITINTCTARQTGNYQVSQFNTAALTSTVPHLCNTNPAFNLMNIVQSATAGTWFPGSVTPGTAVSANQFIPTNLNTGFYQIKYRTTSSPNQTVCPDSTILNVQVTKTITPFITPVQPFCTNSGVKSLTVNPAGGSWFGNNMVSPAGVLTPSNIGTLPQISTVNYSIAIGPCINYGTTNLNVSTFYSAALSGTVSHLCVTSNPVNLMSIAANTVNGTWVGTGVQSGSFMPLGLQTDTYVLTYNTASSPTNLNLCPDTRTIAASVLNPPMPNINNVGPICNNAAPLQLAVTPATGKWTASPYVNANGIFTPSLSSVGNNAVQYVIGTATCNSQQTKFISVEAFVSAKIMTNLPDQCTTGSAVNLGPLTISSLGSWSGPGISGISFNPALAGSGTFTLSHSTASSPSGLCPDEDLMAVNVYSLATPVISNAGPFCNSATPFQLQVTPVGGLFGGNSFGMVSLAGKFDPASALIGDNLVTYSISSGPCMAYSQLTVTVERFISADFEKPVGIICRIPGETTPFNMDSYIQNPGGSWGGSAMVGNMFDPFKATISNNNFVTYTTTSKTGLCTDTSRIRIEVRQAAVMSVVANTLSACSPGEIMFNTPGVSDGIGIGEWNFNDGSEPQRGTSISHVFTTPGTYEATFSYQDEVGCKSRPVKSPVIRIKDSPKADFTVPDEIFISNPEIQLTNLTTVLADNTYQWKIANTYTLDQVNPVVSFPKIGKYQITLVATAEGKGCFDEITKTIEVKNDFNVYIPTSFSPNFDGLNDYFIPVFSEYGLDPKSFEMEIFDRWGHAIYRSKDTTKGWDGSIQNKGEPLKEEVYIYRIKYKDLDGNAYNKMGHVTLLK